MIFESKLTLASLHLLAQIAPELNVNFKKFLGGMDPPRWPLYMAIS